MAREPNPAAVAHDDIAFRYSDYDTPLWARPNSTPGRWHTPSDGPTQYLSVSVEGAWAELIRTEVLTSEDEVRLVRMPMWALVTHVQNVADYRTFGKAAEAGFPPEALVSEDYSLCQHEGRRLRLAGFRGVLAPSAALPGAVNLTLFGPRIASRWGVPTILASAIPATKIAVGSPPEGIVSRIRQRGARHAGLEEYRQRSGSTPDASQDEDGGHYE